MANCLKNLIENFRCRILAVNLWLFQEEHRYSLFLIRNAVTMSLAALQAFDAIKYLPFARSAVDPLKIDLLGVN